MTTPLKLAVHVVGILAVCGCLGEARAQVPKPMGPAAVGEPVGPAPAPPPVAPPSDAALLGSLPIPPMAKILSDQSLIIGSGDTWVGRLTLNVGRDVTGAYTYFLQNFQQQGWTLQSAVRSKISLLVFTKGGRSATIEFQDPKMLEGSRVTVTMAQLGTTASF